MFSKDFLQFLSDLRQNNNRDWFNQHKKHYEKVVKAPFEAFVAQTIEGIQAFDSNINMPAKKAIFRIYRDTRFSKDKTPYKTHVSASFAPKGRFNEDDPGYYLHIESGRIMLGGGAYAISKKGLYRLRTQLRDDRDDFEEIIYDPNFKQCFDQVRGEANKRLPSEFKATFKEFPLIANKQFYYMTELPAETILQKDFLDVVLQHYQAGYAFNNYMHKVFNNS